MDKNLENINIKVGSRTYPVKVNQDEKSSLVVVEKQINDKIQSFKQNYADIDDIDALSMTLIAYASDLNDQDLVTKNNLLDQQLTQLEAELEKALS